MYIKKQIFQTKKNIKSVLDSDVEFILQFGQQPLEPWTRDMSLLLSRLSQRLCNPSQSDLVHLATNLSNAYDLDALDSLLAYNEDQHDKQVIEKTINDEIVDKKPTLCATLTAVESELTTSLDIGEKCASSNSQLHVPICEMCFEPAGRRCSRCKNGNYCSRYVDDLWFKVSNC